MLILVQPSYALNETQNIGSQNNLQIDVQNTVQNVSIQTNISELSNISEILTSQLVNDVFNNTSNNLSNSNLSDVSNLTFFNFTTQNFTIENFIVQNTTLIQNTTQLLINAKKALDANLANDSMSDLYVFTNPGFVDVSFNNLINATSNIDGNLVLLNVTQGINFLFASKINYTNFSSQISILQGNNSVNITLTLLNITTNSTNTSNLTQNVTQNVSYANDIVAISQLGYHPSSIKEVVVYTKILSETFRIRDANTNAIVASFPLSIPKNYAGVDVNCQGNMACLTGDFTNFTIEGNYYIEENGVKSHTFSINKDVFSSTIPIYFEYFNAELQQDSNYHADFHSGYSPPFTSMSDGSFIMEADQSALSLIRLGSAYRRNPQLFQFDKYDVLGSNKPDMQEYIVSYVNYLESLQGVSIQLGDSPSAVRLGSGMIINNIFVPGPTNLTSMNVYIPGTPPTLLQSAPVISLCGVNDGSQIWQTCINNAAKFYKCQIDEPCLNLSYNDIKGTITSNTQTNGFAVSKGWGYEFGCYFDVNLISGGFNNGEINPCHVFYNSTNRKYTSMTLLALLEAWPAVNDFSQVKGNEVLTRSVNTYQYIKNNYPAYTSSDSDSGFYGGALFLLYDYTNNTAYLQEAYNMKSVVSKTFISDTLHGNEFYWEEYVRHKDVINLLGLTYKVNGDNPEEFFRGKIFQDYKDAGPNAISNNGERVFQFDSNIQFQNSRYMLIEGLLAMKTTELVTNSEPFIPVVAQNQLSWLTGMNLVQLGVGLNAQVKSMSFIFGIGDYPTQFHSRWLINTGYTSLSSGKVIGARGTGYRFFDSSKNEYVYFDGVTNIMGNTLGATGNGWHNESTTPVFQLGQSFNNGYKYIPGWINGAYPAIADGDTIFNYNDKANTYEYTETTNEIVATAIEYYAYLDGGLNNKPRYNGNAGNFSIPTNQTNTTTNSTTNSTVNNTNTSNQNVSNSTNTSGAKIIGNSSSLVLVNGSYKMREDKNASFSVTSNSTNSITWFVDGIEQNTIISQNAVFLWSPGILWIPRAPDYSNVAISTIKAQSSTQSVTWNVQVENVVNPFFSNVNNGADVVGSSDTKIHVFTNNKYFNFTKVSVNILSDSGVASYQLTKQFNNSQETEWAIYVPELVPGNNYLTNIIGFNNVTNETLNYNIGFARAHYVTVPSTSSSSRRGGGSRNSYSTSFNPELIYALFEKDIVKPNEFQTLSLDVKNFNGGVYRVNAKLITPLGTNQTLVLNLMNGTNEYGTWAVTFKSPILGKYTLYSVELEGNNNVSLKEIKVQDHTFYSLNENTNLSNVSEKLGLVYSILSQSQVSNGSTVELSLDARDSKGILNVTANITNTKGDKFTIPLKLIKGENVYGTWSGSFIVSKPDTTYFVKSITLKNTNEEKSYYLTDRSVYVFALSNKNLPQSTGPGNLLTGGVTMSPFSGEFWSNTIKKPLVPIILGFSIMLIVIVGLLLFKRK